MKSCYKLWVCTQDGQKFFGEGPCSLLRGVQQSGSLNSSARNMKMAYSKAISIINKAEKELGCKLLIREVGGKNGGGSSITPEAEVLIRKYEEFKERAGLEIERIYLEIFSEQW